MKIPADPAEWCRRTLEAYRCGEWSNTAYAAKARVAEALKLIDGAEDRAAVDALHSAWLAVLEHEFPQLTAEREGMTRAKQAQAAHEANRKRGSKREALAYLDEHGDVSAADLAKRFHVSVKTAHNWRTMQKK